MSAEEKVVVSVITVVFNDRENIVGTLRSVLDQRYPHVEYIVVDGGSTDGTLEILRKESRISRLISEPDKGIYDAMNKGLRVATGEYVWFLNSGDRMNSRDTLELLFQQFGGQLPDIFYGDTRIIDQEGNEVGDRRLKPPERLSWRSFRQGMVVCHQSMIVRRAIAPMYDPAFRISADIDWIIRASKNAGNILNTHMVLSRFLEGGLSTKRYRDGLKERFRIMTRHYGFMPTLLRHFLFGIRLTTFYLKHRRI